MEVNNLQQKRFRFFNPLSKKTKHKIFIISIIMPFVVTFLLYNVFLFFELTSWEFWIFTLIPLFAFFYLFPYLFVSAKSWGIKIIIIFIFLILFHLYFDFA